MPAEPRVVLLCLAWIAFCASGAYGMPAEHSQRGPRLPDGATTEFDNSCRLENILAMVEVAMV